MPRPRTTPRFPLLGGAIASLALTSTLLSPAGATSPADPTLTARADAITVDLSTATAGTGALTASARAEIDRVLAASPAADARTSPRALTQEAVRCAEFEAQRYCLGLGWTSATEAAVVARLSSAATVRRSGAERTGDRDALARIRYVAALTPEQRARAERRELTAAARSVAKIWLLRHQLQGAALPEGFLARHPEIVTRGGGVDPDGTALDPATPIKTAKDYPDAATILKEKRVNDQRTTYWCGPATIQMIAWTKNDPFRPQRYWAKRLRTTTSGSDIVDMVRVINNKTNWDRPKRAGEFIVLDISDFGFGQWTNLIRRHVVDYRAPLVLHPVLLKEYYPYLDDDASGHFQVGRGYDNNGDRPTQVGFFEPWNQQRFDPSEPYIERVQWRNAYKSYRANQEHFLHNVGV
jgi:hypothetical protein